MEIETTTRVARSQAALHKLLSEIEDGARPKPDWIHLQGDCRLDHIAHDAQKRILRRLHACSLRGFKASNVYQKSRAKRIAFWRSVAKAGFHDFTDQGWMKNYDSPFVENYDYIGPYLEGGIDALDAYQVYSSVLGTHDFSVEDFVNTKLCRDVQTIVEPMAGTAEFAYQGHFRYPNHRYVMFDLDEDAKKHVEAKPWLEDTERHYVIADVLEEGIWQQVKSLTTGESLAYIGKQSHHFFGAKQLHRLMDIATRHVDYFMLEVPEPSLVADLEDEDEMTRPEMEDAGFEVALTDKKGFSPNPLTNSLHFQLDVWDKKKRRTLFEYGSWTSWPHHSLVAFADLLDLRALYFHADKNEFVPVAEGEYDEDILDNVTFMMFTRHQ
jgi:hypothetical protein